MKNCFRDNILETEIQRNFMKTKNYVLFTLNKKSFLFTRIMISVQNSLFPMCDFFYKFISIEPIRMVYMII